MIGRIRQFVRAITAQVTAEDQAYVESVLPKKALPLFYGMHRADQRHALNVARTAMELVRQCRAEGTPVDERLLERCALLHDVGRRKGDLDIFGKVFCVLAVNFFPVRARMWAEDGTSKMLAVYFHHPKIGAALLRDIGLSEEAAIIERHHEVPRVDDSLELRLLRLADEAN